MSGDSQLRDEDLEERRVHARVREALLGRSSEPVTIGRYAVLKPVGSGGLGVVYAAYDRELDRKVAVKLVRPDRLGIERGHAAQTRLVREAQAMAKLSHHNIIHVYEVGTVEDQVFVAMQFVEGDSLRAWLEQPGRSWREILSMFAQAGRGLAAAHDGGVVHRDFKPDNVLVDDSERAFVVDFGLARATQPLEQAEQSLAEGRLTVSEPEPTNLATPLTQTGAVLGTPAYMAPEQFRGEPTDARTDQFSFCIALWEGLFGERPFEGDTLAILSSNVAAGRLRPPPSGTRVPTWLRRVVERGLSAEPDRRFPSMGAVLAALAADPAQARRRWLLAGGLALGGAVTIAGFRVDAARTAGQCEAEGERIDHVWGDAERTVVREALLGTGAGHAAQVWERTEQHLDSYATAWKEARAQVCRATNVESARSYELHDASTACLDERRTAVEALVGVLADADAKMLHNAVQSAAGLPMLAPCIDDAWLTHRVPPPEDDPTLHAVAELRKELATATARQIAGRYQEALDQTRALLLRAEPVGYAPLVAEVRVRVGGLEGVVGNYAAAERELEDAFLLAGEVGHDEVALEALTLLVRIVGYRAARHREGLFLGRLATMRLARLGQEHSPRATTLLDYVGSIHEARGALDDALDHYRRALEIREDTLGPQHLRVAYSASSIGSIHDKRGEYDEAVTQYRRALTIRESALGPQHPHVGEALHNLASVRHMMGAHDEAFEDFTRALEIFKASLGPRHSDVATALVNLGRLQHDRGRFDEALAQYRQALEIYETTLGKDHPMVASALKNIGHTHFARGAYAEALEPLQRALQIREAAYGRGHPENGELLGYLGLVHAGLGSHDRGVELLGRALETIERAFGPDHPNVNQTLLYLGTVHGERGSYRQALTYQRRALAGFEATLGAQHPAVAESINNIGGSLLLLRECEAAAAWFRRALEQREATDAPVAFVAATRFRLAQALWCVGKDRARASALAEEARETYRSTGDEDSKSVAEVEAWIESHGLPK